MQLDSYFIIYKVASKRMSRRTGSLVGTLTELSPRRLEVELLRRSEDQWFEKKGPAVAPRDLAKAVVGMANAAGGLVVVGVEKEAVPGIDMGELRGQALTDLALRLTAPPIRFRTRTLAVRSGEVLLLDVEASGEVHALTNDDCFLRVGSETRRLTFAERRELVYDKGQSFFDARPVEGAQLRDVNLRVLSRWASSMGAAKPHGLAVVRGLLTSQRLPTVAGILVFGKNVASQFPQAFVRVVRHRGTEARPGREMAVEVDERFEAALPEILDRSVNATLALLPRVERLAKTGRFSKEPLYPEFAVREAITNAVIHRSYSLGGDHTRVSVFDDRIEVESPGRLPGLVREDNIRTTRFARNPHIARVMAELAFGREFGEGVDRMFREMAAVGLPDPIITQGDASVRVTLLGEPALARLSAAIPGAAGARLAEHLHRVGWITSREAGALLGVSRATALKRLRALVEVGVLEWVASSTTDPTASWQLRGRSGHEGP